MRSKDVFTPGKYPHITFVADHLEEKTRHLRDAIEAGGLVISLSGPSKSGKTVFVQNALGKDSLVHVTGAGINSSERLWERVFDIIGTPIETTKQQDSRFEGMVSAEAEAGISLFAKAKGGAGVSGTWAHGNGKSEKPAIDHLQLFIRDIKESGFFLFIDDFHYILDHAQLDIANQIKEAIRNDVVIITASVPYHSDDILRANQDLRGRIINIDFDYWTPDLLQRIAYSGFEALGMNVSPDLINRLADESAGSPQLMQSLCLNLCFELGIYEKPAAGIEVLYDPDLFVKVCSRTSFSADYNTVVELMRDGPKTRGTDRKGYILRNNKVDDVYPIVIQAIALNPPLLTFRYPILQERIRAVCKDEGPKGSSVTGACQHMEKLANEAANSIIIEWDAENDVLDIRDPYLLFYIRWSNAL